MGIEQYVGKLLDIVAYSGVQPHGEVLLTQELVLPGQSGQICTGIQKLVQRFLLELLTERDSMIYSPTRGCDFMIQARLGELRTPLDVLAAFSAALVDIRSNLLSDERPEDPDEERYDSASVLGVSSEPGWISLKIALNSLAGPARTIILPLSTTLGG